MNETELRDGLAFVAAELRSIHEQAGDAPLDADTQTRFDEGSAYVVETRAALAAIETRRAQVAELASIPTAIERGAPEPVTERTAPNVNLNRSPFEGLERGVRAIDGAELRARALTAIEDHSGYQGVTDEQREGVTQSVTRYGADSVTGRAISELVLGTGSPTYVRAFEDYCARPQNGIPAELRAAMSTTAANGGVLIPHFLDPTINLTNASTNNNVRQLASSVQIATKTWEGVTSAGVTAEWIAEATQVADASPTFVPPTITPGKADAYIQASLEVIQDSGFSEISMLIMDAKDRLEETAFTTGTGSGQPFGLITRLSGTGPAVAGSSGAAGAADFVVADVYAVKNALTPRYRRNASWMANPAIFDVIRGFSNVTAGTAPANFWVDLGAAIPSTLLGKSAYENEGMDSTRVSGSNDDILLFGDFKQYKIVDRIGMELAYNPMVQGANNRPTGEVGWVAFWRTGADVITSNGFKLLRV